MKIPSEVALPESLGNSLYQFLKELEDKDKLDTSATAVYWHIEHIIQSHTK